MFVGKTKGWSESHRYTRDLIREPTTLGLVFDGMQPFAHFLEDVKIQVPSEFTWGSNWLGWR